MSGQIAQIITALAALATVILSIRNGKNITEVHLMVNSRLDELLAATKVVAHSEGVEQERVRQKDGKAP